MRTKQKVINLFADKKISSIKYVISVSNEDELNQLWNFFLSLDVENKEISQTFINFFYNYMIDKFQSSEKFFVDVIIEEAASSLYFTTWNKSISSELKIKLDSKKLEYKHKKNRITVKIEKLSKEKKQKKVKKIKKKDFKKTKVELNKVSSEKFFSEVELDEEVLDEMHDLEYDIDDIFVANRLTDYEKDKFIIFFNAYSKLLNTFIEFEELRGAFGSLIMKLRQYDKYDESETLMLLLKNLIEDLLDWKNKVLVEQISDDIHYMDKSFLCNITQIDMFINGSSEDSNEEDLEFF